VTLYTPAREITPGYIILAACKDPANTRIKAATPQIVFDLYPKFKRRILREPQYTTDVDTLIGGTKMLQRIGYLTGWGKAPLKYTRAMADGWGPYGREYLILSPTEWLKVAPDVLAAFNVVGAYL
jgi:hypothetical protein